ncbi:caspase-1-like isoform X2 [Acanthopagrus latus]|uniref:caspase-1-like isoform X2 n=1 Tax=Acanthopagrus latus TaxID=8177 RepID=UPI00187CE321|nr:caspase-1-like isoform X2 [Acanthopagrus latus]
MADQLLRARVDFVNRVSSPAISQLLHLTLQDCILSFEERQRVHEHRTSADMARALIDTVSRKGDLASRMFISHIQHVEPYLYEVLRESWGLPAPPAAEPQMEEEESFEHSIRVAQSVSQSVRQYTNSHNTTRNQDEASRTMITNIKSKDPTLHSKLACGQTALPAAEPQREKELLTLFLNSPVMSSIFVSVADKLSNTNIYPVTKKSIENRVALLITNINFTDRTLNRYGADRDEANMKNVLRGLGYEVVPHRDLTGDAIGAAIRKFSEHPKLKETDSVVVVIMSHGKLGSVLGVDWKKKTSGDEKPDEFPINDIYKHLGPEECEALTNKPKIIIIQACRGEEDGSVPVKDGANAAEPCEDVDQPGPCSSAGEQNGSSVRRVHREKDFISLLSCTPDTVSYRNPINGSYLIQFVVEVFNTCAQKDHIVELFTKVLQRFEDFPIASDLQMPTINRYSLTKCFYFNPGL